MLIFGERHLQSVVAEHAQHDNGRRPHRGRQFHPPRPDHPVADFSPGEGQAPGRPGRPHQRIRASRAKDQFKPRGRVLEPHRHDLPDPEMTPRMTANLIAAAAVVIALVSFVVNFWWANAADRRGRMPVLVMKRLSTDKTGTNHILLTNVGKGPALNIIFGLAEETEGAGTKQLQKDIQERWFNPLHLVPIAPDGELDVAHPVSSNVLGVTYTDALGNKYTMKTSQYGTKVREGQHLPEIWKIEGVPSMWAELPAKRRWLQTKSDGRAFETSP